MKRLKIIPALLSVCLILSLSSCSKTPPPAPEQVIILPPETVFRPCEQPSLQGDTWGDIGSHALALQTALSICAGQVATLNQWRVAVEEK
ncbi:MULTISPECIES: Rz1-like lysis system protein LysC [Serratia]|uniref:Rz1-like lysis system protein LysC n=1 Tax=Serratia TaxID=613 RepID=UPI001E65D232|nr:Rz1-like lysis system protein LysC [Serratia marcescens]MDS0828271.1 Rz1-like lysis system protein LysC [Serratia marcescens]WPC48273.1 Rz1-like lysis system protein LysC [Serratia marcescens]